tara:strand:+ start:2466 stop:2723 length:258 start_codon:yes stop_codon:yes gene_type:complete
MRSQYNNELDDIREAIAKTFTGTYGEKVLQFLEDTYMNQLSAEPNDPYSTYFNEGGRGLVLGLKAQIYAYKHRDSKPIQQEEVQI